MPPAPPPAPHKIIILRHSKEHQDGTYEHNLALLRYITGNLLEIRGLNYDPQVTVLRAPISPKTLGTLDRLGVQGFPAMLTPNAVYNGADQITAIYDRVLAASRQDRRGRKKKPARGYSRDPVDNYQWSLIEEGEDKEGSISEDDTNMMARFHAMSEWRTQQLQAPAEGRQAPAGALGESDETEVQRPPRPPRPPAMRPRDAPQADNVGEADETENEAQDDYMARIRADNEDGSDGPAFLDDPYRDMFNGRDG